MTNQPLQCSQCLLSLKISTAITVTQQTNSTPRTRKLGSSSDPQSEKCNIQRDIQRYFIIDPGY